jgi:hypothetical protein
MLRTVSGSTPGAMPGGGARSFKHSEPTPDAGPRNRPPVGDHRPTVSVARKCEVLRRVLAQKGQAGRMRAVRHCQRAAEMALGFLKGRLLAEGNVLQVDFLGDAGR